MRVICQNCGKVKSDDGNGGFDSHGLCATCWMLFYPDHFYKALPKPVASMSDCSRCRHADIDSDGMAESCSLSAGKPCVRSDRRSPWGIK